MTSFPAALGLPVTPEEVRQALTLGVTLIPHILAYSLLHFVLPRVLSYLWLPRARTVSVEFLVPYYRNSGFVGRVEILEQIKRELTTPPKRGIFKKRGAVQSRVCLHGPNGIGKTQIALYHVYSLKETQPDTSIFWVQASNVEQLYESYASIAQQCDIPGSSNRGSNPLDLVPWWLENKAKSPWLMVVDGADDMESFFQTNQGKKISGLTDADDVKRDMAAYMPKCSHGAILFTTTNPGSKLFVGASMIEVDALNKTEAKQLIRNTLRSSDPQEDVDDLSWWLSNFPLAITLAISFIGTNSISIKEYIGLLDGARSSLVNLGDSLNVPNLTKELGKPLEVVVPCLVLLQQLEREDKPTSELVQFASFFHRRGILRVFLYQYRTAESLDPLSFEASLTKLKMSSALLERNDDKLEMHRLMQSVIQKLPLQKEVISRAAAKAMSAFWWSYPYGQPITHSTLATYLLNAFSIFRCFEMLFLGDTPQRLAITQTLIVYFESRGRWKDLATRYAQRVVEHVEKRGEEHLETLDLMSKLSFVYMHQRRWEDADMLQSYLRERKGMMLGDHHPSTVMSRECHIVIDLKKRSQEDTTPLLWIEALKRKEREASPTIEAQQPWTGFPWRALKNDILASRKKNVPPSNLPQLVDSIWNRIPSFGPPVPEGQAWIHWACPCGQQLFDDFSSSSAESLQALQQNLQNHNLSSGEGHNSGSSSSQDSTSRPNLKWPWPTFMPGNNFNKFLRQKKEGATTLPMHTRSQIPGPVVNTTPYLLMCIDRGRHFTGLYQHVLQNVEDDTQLFQFLRDNVSRHRGISSWFTFRSVSAISLTRFEADNSQYAEVHRHKEVCGKDCICIPPPERVQNDEYDCSPSPTVKPTQVPVIGTNRLTHYFLKPHAFHGPQRTILNQLPKRARGPLSTSQDSMQLGWGIHIQEGWHWRSIYFVIVVVFLVGGLAFGIAWSIKEKDIQSAFAISATWIAISPLLFGWIAVRDLQ